MTYEGFRKNSTKAFLGFCLIKGFVYSVQLDAGKYAVVALKNAKIDVLISYTVQSSSVNR